MISRILHYIRPMSVQLLNTGTRENLGKCLEAASSRHMGKVTSIRPFSQQVTPEAITVTYDHVKKATTDNNVLIVDVREPDEIKEHGKIPNSVNIPLGNVTPVLSTLSEKEFKQVFHRPKPTEETEIIFYCMIGKRSGMAQQNAINLGFKNTKNYLGSWNDWATQTSKPR